MDALRHEALLYRDLDEDLAGVTGFLRAGLEDGRRAMAAPASELLVAASEAVTNALLHRRPPVRVTMGLDGEDLVTDATDRGTEFADPLAGRRRPALDATGGRGLFIINQLCDLVELRTGAGGTTVRLRMARAR